MPGIHPAGEIAAHLPRRAAGGGQDVQGAVGPQEHEGVALAKDDPLAVGREAREVIAHPVAGRSGQRHGLAAPALVEIDSVDIVAELLAALEELGDLIPFHHGRRGVLEAGERVRLAAGKKDRLAVRAPHRIALDVPPVVGALEGRELLRLPVVDDQDARDRKEPLGIEQIIHGRKHGPVLDRADDVAAVGRDLGQQAERQLLVLAPVVAPGDERVLAQDGLRPHRCDDIGPLVAAVVDVHRQGLAVGREGMAIAADLHAGEQNGRPVRRDLAQVPANRVDVLEDMAEGQRHIAVEDRRAHRV